MTLRDDIIVVIFGIVALIYLLNPTMGLFELIPDNLPIIGNLDEAAATAIVLYSLKYYGIDIFSWVDLARRGPRRRNEN